MQDESKTKKQLVAELAALRQRVADQKGLEEALRRSQEHFGAVMERLPEGVAVTVDRRVVYCNPGLTEITGYGAKKLKGRSLLEFLHPEDRAEYAERLEARYSGAPEHVGEYRALRKDGAVIQVEISSRSIEYDGKPALLSVLRDVTRRKQAEGALLDRTRELEALVRIANILVQPKTFEQKCSDVLEELVRIVQADLVTFRVPDEEGLRLVASAGIDPDSPPAPVVSVVSFETMSGVVFRQKEPVVANDYQASPFARPGPVDLNVRSAVSLPIRAGGRTLGVIGVVSHQPDYFTPEQVRLLMAVADGIGALLENARLYHQISSELIQRQRAETAMRESEQRFRDLFDEAPVGYHEMDAQGRITRVNRTELEMLGYCADDMIGRPEWDFIIEQQESRQMFADLSAGAGASPERGAYECTFRRKDGTTVPVLVQARCLLASGGDLSGFRVTIQDISELKRTQEALRASQQRMHSVLQATNDAVIVTDHEGRVTLFNQSAELMFRVPAAEMSGQPVENLMPRQYRVSHRKGLAGYIQSGESSIIGHTVELEGLRGDGTVFPIELSLGTYNTPDGPAFVGVVRDITERKKTEAGIQEASRLASIGELAAGVAHEINNPLTGVLGFSQLLLEEDLPDQVRADLEKIYSDAQRASKIVQNLLFFARKREPEWRYTPLAPILERALEMKSYDFRVNNISASCDLAPDLPPTMLDEHQLIQLFLNILTNAEQAMRAAQGGSSLTVRAVQSGDQTIRISISDTGPGIAPEHLNRIFEPFFTTKEVGQGTGLGLSICHGIAHQHGGNLWAESSPGEGATFHIELPIVSQGQEPVEPPRKPARSPSPTRHLLVVDDEPLIRDLLTRGLQRERYTVDLAQDGQEALRKLHSRAYDCIIMDLKMPGMSGQELYQLIEARHQDLARKAIFITGDTVSPDTRKFISQVNNPVLNKPFAMEELRQQIRNALQAASGRA